MRPVKAARTLGPLPCEEMRRGQRRSGRAWVVGLEAMAMLVGAAVAVAGLETGTPALMLALLPAAALEGTRRLLKRREQLGGRPAASGAPGARRSLCRRDQTHDQTCEWLGGAARLAPFYTDGAMTDFDTRLEQAGEASSKLKEAIGEVIVGQTEVVDQTLWAMIAGGHVLLEGAPGLGKTLLVRTLSEIRHAQAARCNAGDGYSPQDQARLLRPDLEQEDK